MVRDGLKLKRKEIDDFNDDFSDFSLSSPALKIRRLDADLPPIIEEEEEEDPISSIDHKLNQERAMVLFKPPNGNFTLSVDPDFISAYNRNTSRFFSSSHFPNMKWEGGNDQSEERKENNCLAVVPWVPPLQLPTDGAAVESEFMDADECGPADMDVEEDTIANSNVTEGLPWQQHCLIPQMPHSTSAPITWFQ